MNLFDVTLHVSLQTKTLATGLALVLVLAHMFYHSRFVAETFATCGTFQEELGFPFDFVLIVILLFRIFSRRIILLFRHLSFSSNMSFELIW